MPETVADSDFQAFAGALSERWRHCEGQPECTLLRLAVLRELVRLLHSKKSRYLAQGKRDQITGLRAWENRLQELRQQPRLEGDLVELVTGRSELRKRTRLLPETLLAALGREKLERYDRQWESALAAEACTLGWRFWALEAWVEVPLVEEWNQRLQDALWPSALVLFTESGEAPGNRLREPAPGEQTAPLWLGRWLLIVNGRFKSPTEIAANLEAWDGSPAKPPTPPQWALLYSPKMR